MAFAGNPRKYARDVADGFVLLTPVQLRNHDPGALSEIKLALELELRDTRAQPIAGEELAVVQGRQRRLLRINQGLQVLRTYALKRRLHL